MEAGVTFGSQDWLLLLVFLLAVGLAGGFLAGLLGIGGGVVVVPALYFVFGSFEVDLAVRRDAAHQHRPQLTGARSALSHHRRGAVDLALLKFWGPALLVGVVVGAVLAGYMSTAALTLLFALVTLFNATTMAFGGGGRALSDTLPKSPLTLLVPATIGGVSSMTGLGGGALIVPTLTLFRYPIHTAVGTAAGFGLLIGAAGTAGFIATGLGQPGLPPFPWTVGFVSVPGLIAVAVASVAAAPLGAAVAHRMSRTLLRRTFAVFLVIVAVRLLMEVAGV